MVLASAFLILPACGAAPPRIPAPLVIDHVVEVPVTRPCALRPQPSYVDVPAPSPCQSGMACWPLPQLADLVDNIEALREWADEMERLCPPPASAPASQPEPAHPP